VRESAVSAKLLLGYGLARNRRSPKRPSEPRPSGVHPEEAQWMENEKPPRFESLLRVCRIMLVLIAEIEPSWSDLVDGPLNAAVSYKHPICWAQRYSAGKLRVIRRQFRGNI